MSLCWQNLDPLEDRDVRDISRSNANLPDGEEFEPRRMMVQFRVWYQRVLSGLSSARLRAATK